MVQWMCQSQFFGDAASLGWPGANIMDADCRVWFFVVVLGIKAALHCMHVGEGMCWSAAAAWMMCSGLQQQGWWELIVAAGRCRPAGWEDYLMSASDAARCSSAPQAVNPIVVTLRHAGSVGTYYIQTYMNRQQVSIDQYGGCGPLLLLLINLFHWFCHKINKRAPWSNFICDVELS